MHMLPLLLVLLPVIVIFLLLILRRTPADIAGLIGWVATMLVAWVFFKTPLAIAFKASLSGVLASLPIALMVAVSILQITLMQETGAMARIVALIKTISPSNRVVQIMLVNMGFGTLLAALGATPVSILPPIMLAMGYSSFISIALPAIGYDALCTYALLGIPVVVFAGFVGKPVAEVGIYFARYMPFISTCIALGMLWIAGKGEMLRKGFFPALLAGLTAGMVAIGMNSIGLITITGIAAGLGVVLVMLLYLKLFRQPIVDRSALTEKDLAAERSMPLWKALSPWIILVVFSLLVNAPFLPFFNLVFTKFAMPVEVIPGAPEKLRVLWQAYFWVLVSTVLALPFLKPTGSQVKASMRRWFKRFPRPMLAAGVFFAIALVINHSGKGLDWSLANPENNMVVVLANAAANAFGRFYPLAAPYLGLFAGFISGSETSAIAMLTTLHLTTAQQIGGVGLVIAAASGIGGGLASVISPAKLQNAAASIDRIGEEARVIPLTFVISVIITAVCAVLTFVWSF
ncbi:MAG: lactate permease [Anaerolinea sp.]|nr:lactate permease [Anaerolinea sp.]